MAWAGLTIAKTNEPFRSEAGAEAIVFPEGVFAGERKGLLAGCLVCGKSAAHSPCWMIGAAIPFGETRHQRIPAARRPDVVTAHRIASALWLAGMIHQPMDTGDLAINAGEANNATQYVDCAIVSVAGNVLTVRGPNPKRIVLGRSVPNPDWPGDGPRLLTESYECALPIGAMVKFAEPSCLAGKLRPYVIGVEVPETDDEGETEWSVELSCDVSNAEAPADLAFPASEYRCRFYWYAFSPEKWPNWQVAEETQFTRRSKTFTRAEIEAASGVVTLDNSSEGETRVLTEALWAGALTVESVAGPRDAAWIAARLTTTQVGYRSWETRLDLGDLLTEEPGTTSVDVEWMPEAVSGDSWRLQFPSGCGNCQKDRTGSYVHHDGWRCTKASEASAFGTFKRSCWQPSCDGFAIGYVGNAVGTLTRGADDARDTTWWGPMWTRQSMVVVQYLEGFGFFTLKMPAHGGPSIEGLVGGWSDSVPTGKFPSQTPLFGAVFGQREEFEDEDGPNHRIVHGLFQAREEWTAGTTPTQGAAGELISGWNSRTNALGAAMSARQRQFPTRGAGNTHLYEWEPSSSGLGWSNKLVEGQAAYATGMDLAEAEDSELAGVVRARF